MVALPCPNAPFIKRFPPDGLSCVDRGLQQHCICSSGIYNVYLLLTESDFLGVLRQQMVQVQGACDNFCDCVEKGHCFEHAPVQCYCGILCVSRGGA